ncbi:MAG: adenosine deaminase family protein [Eubacterium sp.]|nr:adenosine deaminase family protein [Eubacterium sp.]
MIDDQYICELHLHLDGSLSPETVKYLAQLQGIDLPVDMSFGGLSETEELRGTANEITANEASGRYDSLQKLLSVSQDCRDLNEYLEKFSLPLSLLQTEDAISYAVKSIGHAEEALGVDYVEIRFAPQLHTSKGLTQRQVIEAAADSAVFFNADNNTKIRLILCCMRGDDNYNANLETVRLAAEFMHPTKINKPKGTDAVISDTEDSLASIDHSDTEDSLASIDHSDTEDSLASIDHSENEGAAYKEVYIPHVVGGLLPVIAGIDLAGAEALYPTDRFSDIFHLARKLEVPFTIHAGEASGPESIWSAINMGAKRIGHGVAAIKDEKLMDYLAANDIVLECCPTSNLNTKVFNDYAELPIREFLKRGIKATVSTDNMTVSNTTISEEFRHLRDAGLTDDEYKQLLKNAEEGWL